MQSLLSQSLLVTPLCLSVLLPLQVFLAFRVIQRRRQVLIPRGAGEDKALDKRIRAHGNFSEYAPLFLVGLAVLEWNRGPLWWVIVLAAAFVVGRFFHAYGISMRRENLKYRQLGMVLTFMPLIALAVTHLVMAGLTAFG